MPLTSLYYHIFLPVCFCCCSRDDEQIGSETPSQGRLSQMPDVGASDGRRPGANLMELMNKVHKGGLTNEEAPPHHSITYFPPGMDVLTKSWLGSFGVIILVPRTRGLV